MRRIFYVSVVILVSACGGGGDGAREGPTPGVVSGAVPEKATTAPGLKMTVRSNYADASGNVDPAKVEQASKNFNAMGEASQK